MLVIIEWLGHVAWVHEEFVATCYEFLPFYLHWRKVAPPLDSPITFNRNFFISQLEQGKTEYTIFIGGFHDESRQPLQFPWSCGSRHLFGVPCSPCSSAISGLCFLAEITADGERVVQLGAPVGQWLQFHCGPQPWVRPQELHDHVLR